MKQWFILFPAVALYALLVPAVANYLSTEHRRVEIAFPPSYKALKAVSLDQGLLVGEYLVIKVITFLGGRSVPGANKLTRDDYYMMYRNLEVATRLDPYNIDAYYFAQATLTWEVKEFRAANALLDYGMKYRTWDFYLPFFAAFNYSYFLKDPANAAIYYRKAAEVSGNDLFMRLASRNLYDAGRTLEAMAYLKVMIESTRNEALKLMLKKRFNAFAAARQIELARDNYRKQTGKTPVSIDDLLNAKLLSSLPVDPYGGKFILDENSMVRSTSNFSEGKAQQQMAPEQK